jgi:hypothetical protein
MATRGRAVISDTFTLGIVPELSAADLAAPEKSDQDDAGKETADVGEVGDAAALRRERVLRDASEAVEELR